MKENKTSSPDLSPSPLCEKTFQFLKSLTDLITNHSRLISFIPGERALGQIKMPGRIVIHDRNQLQQVLPLYFNHASYSSFRRQLSNYSFFSTIKGRQSDNVIFINKNVVELKDILHLKGNPRSTQAPQQQQEKQFRDDMHETFGDVALAVSSGRMNALKANNDLEESKPKQLSIDTGTSKSISSTTTATTSRAVTASNKVSQKKKCRKRRDKLIQKLLKNNEHVKFIHLPAPVITRICHREEEMD